MTVCVEITEHPRTSSKAGMIIRDDQLQGMATMAIARRGMVHRAREMVMGGRINACLGL